MSFFYRRWYIAIQIIFFVPLAELNCHMVPYAIGRPHESQIIALHMKIPNVRRVLVRDLDNSDNFSTYIKLHFNDFSSLWGSHYVN